MPLHSAHIVHLLDANERQVGQIVIERREDELVFGKFVPGPAFPAVQHLFREFEEAVNLQALSVVDELDRAIAALGLQVRSLDGLQRVAIHDVQIWSDGSITCRVGAPTLSAAERDREAARPIQAAKGSDRLTSR